MPECHADPCVCGHRRGLHTGPGATRTARGTVLDDGPCIGSINADGVGDGCECHRFRSKDVADRLWRRMELHEENEMAPSGGVRR